MKISELLSEDLKESRMKDLALDLEPPPDGLSDSAFKKKYGKTKQEMRQEV